MADVQSADVQSARGSIGLIAALAFTGVAAAQDSQQGAITGFVYDQSQAVLPNTQIVVTSEAAGLSRTAGTNEAGVYTVVALQLGIYSSRPARRVSRRSGRPASS